MRTPITTSLGRRTVISTDLNTPRDFAGNRLWSSTIQPWLATFQPWQWKGTRVDTALNRRTPITTNLT